MKLKNPIPKIQEQSQGVSTTIFVMMFLAVGTVIYFIWQFIKLKLESGQKEIPVPKLPNGGSDIPAGFETEALRIAARVKEVTDGLFTLAAEKEQAFVILDSLNDDQLVYVYRVYSNQYSVNDPNRETMTEVIDNEWNVSLNSIRKNLVARLISLGAK